MSNAISTKTVLIYGGGVAGALLAKNLSEVAQVTLVEPLDYFEVPMAVPRSLVQPDFANKAIMAFKDVLPSVRHVQGKLRTLTMGGGVVELVSGQTVNLKADVSVLATGSRLSNELMRAHAGNSKTRKGLYERYAKRIKEANSIVIVGGGPIGVEVAGEILEVAPGKTLTLIEAAPRILSGTTPAAAEHALKFLQDRGVTVLTNEKLVEGGSGPDDVFAPGGTAVTASGRRIPYDLMIWCTGGIPNTAYMREQFSSVINDQGRIKVTPELLVVGFQRLFALGDITDLDENKMAWHIAGQVKVAETNIGKALAGEPIAAGSFVQYQAQTNNPSMVVTLGSKSGVVHLKGLGLVKWGFFASLVKARHMLVPKYRKALRA